MPELPEELKQALDEGSLTREQLEKLVGLEAQALGLSFEGAVEAARAGKLPVTDLGTLLEFHIEMLETAAA
jgi:hypothetical protein